MIYVINHNSFNLSLRDASLSPLANSATWSRRAYQIIIETKKYTA